MRSLKTRTIRSLKGWYFTNIFLTEIFREELESVGEGDGDGLMEMNIVTEMILGCRFLMFSILYSIIVVIEIFRGKFESSDGSGKKRKGNSIASDSTTKKRK